MSAVVLGVVSLVCTLVGLAVGMVLHNTLPNHHLSSDSREAVKIASGLIGTLAALVLGLLVSSAKNSFDAMNDAIIEGSAKLIMLDRILAQYGPQTGEIRSEFRKSFVKRISQIWPEHGNFASEMTSTEKSPLAMEILAVKLTELKPENDTQRDFQNSAMQICKDIQQMRWLVIERAQVSLPPLFIVILLFWLTMLFGTFGLLAPTNKTVIGALIICAMSAAGAIFLIEEMNRPLGGMVKVSSAPLVKAIEHMGMDVSISDQHLTNEEAR